MVGKGKIKIKNFKSSYRGEIRFFVNLGWFEEDRDIVYRCKRWEIVIKVI